MRLTWLTLRHWLQAWKTWWTGSPDPVPEPVPASPATAQPVPEQDPEQDPEEDGEIPEYLKPKPPPDVQAQALFEWLQERYPGELLFACEVRDDCYLDLLDEKGWQPQPWDGRRSVGKYLGDLAEKRLIWILNECGERERVRAYLIPHRDAQRGRAADSAASAKAPDRAGLTRVF